MTHQKIAVVILNWNGEVLLKQFLPSVITHSVEANIYVIDNASTDNSIRWLKDNYPEVKIISLIKNSGYAGGYQEGLMQIEADIYCLLNNDVQVTSNWLVPILNLFKSDAKIAAIQPKILDFKKTDYFEYAGAGGGFIDALGYPYCRGRVFDTIEKDEGQYNDEVPIFWASGACLFIRKADYWETGGLDIDYFAHQEEIDLCWRLHNLGKKVFYTGKSVVFHLGGSSLGYENPQKTYLNFRNSLFSIVKNYYGKRVVLIVLTRMLLDGIAGVKFLTEGKLDHFIAIIRAHVGFYKKLPNFIVKRKNLSQKKTSVEIKSIIYTYFLKK